MSIRRPRTSRRLSFNRRRRVAGVAVASVVAAAVAISACGSSSSGSGGSSSSSGSGGGGSSSAKIHLTMWQQWGGGHEEAELQTIINQYEKLHPNVTITQTPVTNDAKILAAIVGGNPPDILDLGTSLMLGGWASQGAIMPLDSMIASSHLNMSAYNQRALAGMKVNGQTYALPFQSFDAALLYNKKLFAQAGLKPPTTFAELNADAIKLTKQSSSGQITQMGFAPDYPGPDQGQTCPLESYGWLFGGQWANGSGQPTPDTAQSLAALQWEQSFYKRFGASNVSNFISSAGAYLTSGDPFESGKMAMMFDGPWSEQYAKANNPKLASEVGVVKFPAPSPANDGTTFLDSNPQIIPRGSSNPQAAFDFISWETSNPQVTATFANTVANIPQLESVPKFPLESDQLFDLYVKEASSPQAHVWPQNAKASTYATDLCQAQSSALVGGKSAQAALQNLASQLKQQ
jgi:multiple sugar transport system substrate-binding protein